MPRLVDLVAKRLKLNIQYDASQLKGQLTLRLGSAISDEDLWALTNRLLSQAGFTSVQLPGEENLSIVKLGDAPSLARIESDPTKARAGFVRFVRPLRYKSAKEIQESVGLVITKGTGVAAPMAGGKSLLLADLKPQILQALAVIDALDAPSPSALEEVEVHQQKATEITTFVEKLLTTQTQVGADTHVGKLIPASDEKRIFLVCPESEKAYWRGLIAQLDHAEATQTATYRPKNFGLREVVRLLEDAVRGPTSPMDPWRVVVDELTGSLLITATPAQHKEIAALVERLDAKEARSHRTMRTFAIVNRSVAEVVEVLQKLIEGGVLEGRVNTAATVQATQTLPASYPSNMQAPPAQPAAASPSPGTSQGSAPLTLTADLATNSILALGESRLVDQLERLLPTIDVREPQVMLETLVLSVNDSDTLNLGIELQALAHDGDTQAALASLFGLGSPSPTLGSIPPPTGTGFSGVVLNPGQWSGVLRALETLQHGRTLTVPKILVHNHQQARLDSVLQQPYASTNASTTVATTSYGGSLDAGTILTVKPHLTEADQLQLEYTVSLSSFVGTAQENLPPPRQQSSIQSHVTIPDGYTVVVGGLEITTDTEARTQIPILGDIPILGYFFKSTITTKSKTRFFVFIRPSVMRDARFEDLRFLSDRALRDADLPENGPVVEPRLLR